MKAEPILLVGKVIQPEGTLFRIPVYQRNYSWDEEQCKTLLDDIDRILTSGKSKTHFLGTMVYVESDENSYLLDNEYIVIDGQQRLTTIMIFLKALQDCAKNFNDDHDIAGTIDGLLYNTGYETSKYFRIKLKAPGSDYEKFTDLLQDKHDKLKDSDRILKNYQICIKRINQCLNSGFEPKKILWAVKQLEVVKIVMDKNDNQHAIFESLNSTGLNLSQADLIRNFLLMNESPAEQEKLFEYWQVIERNLKNGSSYEEINNFFADYLIFITNSTQGVYKKNLYRSFVDLFNDKNLTRQETLSELKKFSSIYRAFISKDSDKKYPPDVMKYLDDLRTLKQTTCYPFLLHVFDDYENNIIDTNTLSKVVRFIFSYILRRRVCEIESSGLNKLFASLYSRIFKVADKNTKYYEAVNKFMSTQLSKDAMPNDSEFENALLNSNMYSKPLCKFLLMSIENGLSKEKITLQGEKLTIEHIMPQTLTREWQRIFSPEEHAKYLHTLGNLTITGYNSELSNKSFAEKIDMITSADNPTKATKLNFDVINKYTWTINEIQARAERLAKIVIDLFSAEKINDPDIRFDDLTKITLDDFSTVTYKILYSFVFDGEEYKQDTFAIMLVDVVKILDELKPN